MSELKRALLVMAGFICLAIAAVGVVVPFLPTVDFLLLAAWCFYRGSPRLHAWLLSLKAWARSFETGKSIGSFGLVGRRGVW